MPGSSSIIMTEAVVCLTKTVTMPADSFVPATASLTNFVIFSICVSPRMLMRIGTVFTAMSMLHAAEKPPLGASQGLATGLLQNAIECTLCCKSAERPHHGLTQNPFVLQLVQEGKCVCKRFLFSHIVISPAPLITVGFELLASDEYLRQLLDPRLRSRQTFRVVIVQHHLLHPGNPPNAHPANSRMQSPEESRQTTRIP